MPLYLLNADGKSTNGFRDLEEARKAGVALAKNGKQVCIELHRAPAPTLKWCYHDDIGEWVENRQN